MKEIEYFKRYAKSINTYTYNLIGDVTSLVKGLTWTMKKQWNGIRRGRM